MNLDHLTLADAARLIKQRELSPVELIRSRLELIERFDGQLNSFIRVLSTEALAAAKQAEVEITAGNYKGPLHGIPIGLKDVFETAGIPTTCHSKIMQNHVPSTDAVVVTRLKKAGAIILGKLAAHEFSLGGPSKDLPWPLARNPWDPTCFTGGSSSGSGVAVAAGFVFGGTATDSGGSTRNPAAHCGVAGIKPTYGLVSRTGVIPLSYSLDHVGVLAWTAKDCAILLQGMAGFDSADPVSVNKLIPDYQAGLTEEIRGLRIGVLRHFYTTDNKANEETRNAIESSIKTFEEMGCIVQEMVLSPLSEWSACGVIIMLAEGYAIHESNLQNRFTDYGEIFRDRLVLGGLCTSADYFEAMRRRKELINEFDQAMQKYDVILTATVTREAPKVEKIGKFSVLEQPLLTMPFNLTGNPAMSVCCGYTDTGLPLAMQIVGKRFEDQTVLRLAYAYEQATNWRDRRPNLSLIIQ